MRRSRVASRRCERWRATEPVATPLASRIGGGIVAAVPAVAGAIIFPASGEYVMADHPGENRAGTDIAGARPVTRSRGLTVALAGLIVLVVAGGWAYDHRVEYAT